MDLTVLGLVVWLSYRVFVGRFEDQAIVVRRIIPDEPRYISTPWIGVAEIDTDATFPRWIPNLTSAIPVTVNGPVQSHFHPPVSGHEPSGPIVELPVLGNVLTSNPQFFYDWPRVDVL